jgi:hypothetical protein
MTKKEVQSLKQGTSVVYRGEVYYFYAFNGLTTWLDRVPNKVTRLNTVSCDYKDLDYPTELMRALL